MFLSLLGGTYYVYTQAAATVLEDVRFLGDSYATETVEASHRQTAVGSAGGSHRAYDLVCRWLG